MHFLVLCRGVKDYFFVENLQQFIAKVRDLQLLRQLGEVLLLDILAGAAKDRVHVRQQFVNTDQVRPF